MALHPRQGALIDWEAPRPGWKPKAAPALPDPEEPRTSLRWARTKKGGKGAVIGPVGIVKVGATLEAFDPKKGQHHTMTIGYLGRPFKRGRGLLLVYGYEGAPVAKVGPGRFAKPRR